MELYFTVMKPIYLIKSTCLIIALIFCSSVFAQTKLIAFKSQGGDLSDFTVNSNDPGNFGLVTKFLPVESPDTIIKLNDSVYVFVNSLGRDSVTSMPILKPNEKDLTLDDLKSFYPSTVFKGFTFELEEEQGDTQDSEKEFLPILFSGTDFGDGWLVALVTFISTIALSILIWKFNKNRVIQVS